MTDWCMEQDDGCEPPETQWIFVNLWVWLVQEGWEGTWTPHSAVSQAQKQLLLMQAMLFLASLHKYSVINHKHMICMCADTGHTCIHTQCSICKEMYCKRYITHVWMWMKNSTYAGNVCSQLRKPTKSWATSKAGWPAGPGR